MLYTVIFAVIGTTLGLYLDSVSSGPSVSIEAEDSAQDPLEAKRSQLEEAARAYENGKDPVTQS